MHPLDERLYMLLRFNYFALFLSVIGHLSGVNGLLEKTVMIDELMD